MTTLKDNSKRANNSILLIYMVSFLALISLGINAFSLSFFYNTYNSITNNFFETLDYFITGHAVVLIITYIISAIFFIMWFRRAYYNLHQITPYLSHSEGWAAGAWFVPILNLFRPYQIMMELYEKTIEKLQFNTTNIEEKLPTSIIGWWWGLWIIGSIIDQIIFRMDTASQTLYILSIFSDILTIICAFLVIKVIKNYSQIEPLLRHTDIDIINQIGQPEEEEI